MPTKPHPSAVKALRSARSGLRGNQTEMSARRAGRILANPPEPLKIKIVKKGSKK